MKKSKLVLTQHRLFLLFTFFYLIFSFATYKDYGITFDEKVEYDAGKFLLTYYENPTSVGYVTRLINNKPNYIEARHLSLFSVYSRIYPALLNLLNPHYYFEWFHFQNLVFGYFMFLFSYALFFLHYRNSYKAVVAPLFLALTSVLLGHIPANPKDIPFATTYLLGILAIFFFKKRSTNKNLEILVLGVIFGLAQSQRAVGSTLFIAYIVFRLFSSKSLNLNRQLDTLMQFILIFFVSLVVWVTCLPFLGANLPTNLMSLFLNSARYADWDHEIIYFGKYLTRDQRPWHYLFVYLLLQLPLFSIFSIIGGGVALSLRKIKYSLTHPIALVTFLFVLNSVIYLVLHPIVYNGIRHFLYLMVCATLIAGFLFVDLLDSLKSKEKRLLLVVAGLYCLFTAIRMSHLHPYEYIYYNELAGGLKNVVGKFDVDYWGSAYKEGAEYARDLIDSKDLDKAKVYSCDNQFAVVYYSEFRYELTGYSREADIVICDLHKDGLRDYGEKFPIIKTIEREGAPIFNIRASKSFIEKYLQQ